MHQNFKRKIRFLAQKAVQRLPDVAAVLIGSGANAHQRFHGQTSLG